MKRGAAVRSRRLWSAGGSILIAAATLALSSMAGSVALAGVALLGGALAGLATQAGATFDPVVGRRERELPTAWTLPALLVVAESLTLRVLAEAPSPPLPQLVAIALMVALVAVALLVQDAWISSGPNAGGAVRFGFGVLLYAVAFALFSAVHALRPSGPLLGALSGIIALALALTLLRGRAAPAQRVRAFALAIGLALGQVGAGLTFWATPLLVNGGVQLLLFYVLVGLADAALDENLDRRVLLEYGIVAVVGMGLVLSAAAWRA